MRRYRPVYDPSFFVSCRNYDQIWIGMMSKWNYRHHRSSFRFEGLNLILRDTFKTSGKLESCSSSTYLRASWNVPSFPQPLRGPPPPFQTSVKPRFENPSRPGHQIWLYLCGLSWGRPILHFAFQERRQNIDRPAKLFHQETYLVSYAASGTPSWLFLQRVWFHTSRSRIWCRIYG